jgi:hypothetical protein
MARPRCAKGRRLSKDKKCHVDKQCVFPATRKPPTLKNERMGRAVGLFTNESRLHMWLGGA